MVSFNGLGKTVSRLESYYEESVYFLHTTSKGVPGTHFVDLGKDEKLSQP